MLRKTGNETQVRQQHRVTPEMNRLIPPKKRTFLLFFLLQSHVETGGEMAEIAFLLCCVPYLRLRAGSPC